MRSEWMSSTASVSSIYRREANGYTPLWFYMRNNRKEMLHSDR